MAIGDTIRAALSAHRPNTPGSVISDFVTLNDDAETAQDSGDLVAPASVDQTTFKWVRVEPGFTRVLIAANITGSITAVGTSPVVRLFGLANYNDDTNDNGMGMPIRLDSPTDISATGVTVTVGTLATHTFLYSLPGSVIGRLSAVTSATGYDLQGCRWVGCAVETAASVTGSGTISIVGKFLN